MECDALAGGRTDVAHVVGIQNTASGSVDPRGRLYLPCAVRDWSFMIPVWAIIFYVFRDDQKKRTMIFMLTSLAMTHILVLSNAESALTLSYQFGTLLALLPIRLYIGKRGSGKQGVASKWLYYIYYPLHMALLTMQN